MVGHFDPDPELCQAYAQFAAGLERRQIKIIYWSLFGTNLLILFLASWIYTKGQRALERLPQQGAKRASTLRTYILLCAACVLVSAVVVIMESFALLALQFCDGEDLMSLYWSTWTMLQVGSLIAIVGIILALLVPLWDSKHPPWALALGTPVLVIAGVFHLLHDGTRRGINRLRRRSSDVDDDGPPISRADTMKTVCDQESQDDETESKMQVEFIGWTAAGGPIVRFLGPVPQMMRGQGDILGRDDDDQTIMAYRKGFIKFAPEPAAETLSSG